MARRLARDCNEYAAQMRRDFPGRFASFAALPLPDLDGSLAELAYAFDVLGAAGVGLFTTYGDKWIADPAFAPVFAELNRRKATVYIHPIASSTRSNPVPAVATAVVEYPIETTRAIIDWIVRDTTAKYPDIRVIFSHSGGLITAAVGRLQILIDSLAPLQKQFPDRVKASLGRLYFECSNSTDPVSMAALRGTVPLSHILLGTDSPFGPMAPTIDQLKMLNLPAADVYANRAWECAGPHAEPSNDFTRDRAALMTLKLSLATGVYDRTRAFADGSAKIDGVEIAHTGQFPGDFFPKIFEDGAFDAAEMALTLYVATLDQENPPFVRDPGLPGPAFPTLGDVHQQRQRYSFAA